jgi:hypothetical protein
MDLSTPKNLKEFVSVGSHIDGSGHPKKLEACRERLL